MRLIQLDLVGPEDPAPTDHTAALVHDILWAHAGPVSGLEHIRARAGPDAVHLSILLDEAVDDPLTEVLRLIEKAVHGSTYLSGWRAVRRTHSTNEGTEH